MKGVIQAQILELLLTFTSFFFAYTHDHLQGLAEYQYPVNFGPTVWRENRFLKLPTSVKVVCSHVPIGGWGKGRLLYGEEGHRLKYVSCIFKVFYSGSSFTK